MYAARNIAATAATHVWFHLKDRVHRFVKMNSNCREERIARSMQTRGSSARET
jgi:hypothetical protein